MNQLIKKIIRGKVLYKDIPFETKTNKRFNIELFKQIQSIYNNVNVNVYDIFKNMTKEMKEDKDISLYLLKYESFFYPEKYADDKEYAINAININIKCIKYVSIDIMDKNFIFNILTSDFITYAQYMNYIPRKVFNDKDFMIKLIKNNVNHKNYRNYLWVIYINLSKNLLRDISFIINVINLTKDIRILDYISHILKLDKKFIKRIYKETKNGYIFYIVNNYYTENDEEVDLILELLDIYLDAKIITKIPIKYLNYEKIMFKLICLVPEILSYEYSKYQIFELSIKYINIISEKVVKNIILNNPNIFKYIHLPIENIFDILKYNKEILRLYKKYNSYMIKSFQIMNIHYYSNDIGRIKFIKYKRKSPIYKYGDVIIKYE